VALAYPGSPAGVPRADDLSAIRAVGFTGVAWRPSDKAAYAALEQMAGSLQLTVVQRTGSIKVARHAPDLQALLWRAVAGGSKVITIDPGQAAGTGLTGTTGERLPWTSTVSTFAGQIAASGRLFAIARPGPAIAKPPAPAKGVEVALLDGGRAWLLIATSTASTRASFVVDLPSDVPAALWLSLLDGAMMSMLKQASGPRWSATIDPGAALVFVIDKAPR
jgi:hypothetical protein